ncbi:hypothetical protein Dsin_016338 [Dipteronia sinensis]|uniref:Uncharacterized protein n=1 Tax=Dipteronia sinensis TaxID=43782 RepID=A0AAE0AE32_9ROSI|nr:hypothetical protein Dsin_016338 [Dipteronia sinensis]
MPHAEVSVSNVFAAIQQALGSLDSVVVHSSVGSNPVLGMVSSAILVASLGLTSLVAHTTSVVAAQVYRSQHVGGSDDSLIDAPVRSSRVRAGHVSSEGSSSILDVSASVVVSISTTISMVGHGSKVGRDSISLLVSFAQPIVSSVVSIDELDDRRVQFLLRLRGSIRIGNDSTRRVLRVLCRLYHPFLLCIDEPMVTFSSFASGFWYSLGLHFVEENEMDGLLPSIWVFACDSISDAQGLRNLVDLVSSSWLVVGDFNAVLGAHESLGSRFLLLRVLVWILVFADLESDIKKKLVELQSVRFQMSDQGFSEQLFLVELHVHHDLGVLLYRHECFLRDRYMVIIHFFSSNSSRFEYDFSMVDDVIPNMVTVAENDFLIDIPSVEDIHDAIFAMDETSAFGPDGFFGKFYQHCWEIVGGDVVLAVQDFFRCGQFFQCLIPVS